MPLQDKLAWPQQLRGRLGGGLTDRLGLAELPWEVAGARAQGGGGGQGSVAEAGSGLEALVSFLCFVSGWELFVQRRAARQDGPRRRWRRRDDGVVWLERHTAAGNMLW